jgi:site-specific recombinase XerD
MGPDASRAFVEFFTAQIRNPNTRHAYFRCVRRFLEFIDGHGVPLDRVEPFHVAAFVERLGERFAATSIKQHLAALRMLGAFLVVRQVLPRNPASDVRGPRHVVRVGKTPVLTGADARALFASIDASTPAGLRDRALLGVMVYTFARVSATIGLDTSDYFQAGRRMVLRLREKGGLDHEMPVHHALVEYLDAYLAIAGEPAGQGDRPLFRSLARDRLGFTERRLDRREALAMVKRRCRAAGLGDRFTNHTFRATGITAYLKNGGLLEHAQLMAGHASPRTTKLYDRRSQEASLDEV